MPKDKLSKASRNAVDIFDLCTQEYALLMETGSPAGFNAAKACYVDSKIRLERRITRLEATIRRLRCSTT